MSKRQCALPANWPKVWLVSDARNDALLERVLARLPRGSGLVFRHYHLPEPERRVRFALLARIARRHGHCLALSGPARLARRWGADAAYGSPRQLARGPALPRLVTAHSLAEVARARRARASAVVISPVHPTRSHPGAKALGPLRFRRLAARAGGPVIALGGMDKKRGKTLGSVAWAAIDGLIPETRLAGIAQDS